MVVIKREMDGLNLVQVEISITYAAQSFFSSSAFHIPRSLSRRALSSAIGSSISSEAVYKEHFTYHGIFS